MSKKTVWLIIAVSLILIGGGIFSFVMSQLNWDFTKLSTSEYVTNSYEINDSFKNISIDTDTADIVFVPSENENISVVCYEQKNVKHSVKLKDDALVIELKDTRKWYECIGINFGASKITVYVPQGEYGEFSVKTSTGDVTIPKTYTFESVDISVSTGNVKCLASAFGKIKIKSSTGNIRVENVSADTLDLSTSTGKVTASNVLCENDVKIKVSTGDTNITDIKCKNVISNGSTGDMFLENVIAENMFSIERSTGDVKLKSCDAGELYIETDTGDVKGKLLSEKVFITKTDTGKVDVPKTLSGGRCEITTDTGNIKISVGWYLD